MYVCLCFSDRTLMFLIRCRKFHCSYFYIVLIYNDVSVFTYDLSFMGYFLTLESTYIIIIIKI